MEMRGRLLSKVEKHNTGCWLWQGCIDRGGYGTIRIGGRSGKTEKAHRVSYEEFVGSISEGQHVLHKCDVRNCINPDHLFLGTNADNVADRESKGRGFIPRLKGGDCPWAKITLGDVARIRDRLSAGERQHVIAADYGIAQSQVSMIKTRQRWT